MADIGVTAGDPVIEEVVDQLVLETLIQESVVRATIDDVTSRIRPGMDTLKMPRFSQLAAASKGEGADLTPAVPTIATDDLVLSSHEAVAWSLEDKANLASNVEINAVLLRDAAKTLVEKVDDDIVTEMFASESAAPDHSLQYANDPTDTIQEIDVLNSLELLDLAKVPRSDRFLLIPPAQKKAMLQLAKFIQADRYGGGQAPLINGEIGMVFGAKVVESTSASLSTTNSVVYHRSCVSYGSQQGARLERERKALGLKEDWVLSMIYGVKGRGAGLRHVTLD